MKERVNKPRAFLSYSSEDNDFITRIENDLRSCQIDSWRDRKDIRDGQPWLESIFEEGLPTCDVVIVYFTEHSLNSDMVAKEVDAAQIRRLADKGISFLPYVNLSETRNALRLDLQTLHCRVWNDENYSEIFPSVVAEIWRSYMERNVAIAIAQEKTGRLEAELELQRLKASLNDSAFSNQEDREFRHILSKLQRYNEASASVFVEATTEEKKTESVEQGLCRFRVSFINALKIKIDEEGRYFGSSFLDAVAKEIRNSDLLTSLPVENGKLGRLEFVNNPTPTLMIAGLLQEERQESRLLAAGSFFTNHVFNEKMYRFVSWLDYNEMFSSERTYEFVEYIPKSSEIFSR